MKQVVKDVYREFRDKELLVQASAIAFRLLVAIVPTALFVIAALGALQLESLWTEEAAPELRENVSGPVYAILDDAVTRVLESQQAYWITIGAVLAVGAMASVVDAVTRTLNRIHDAEETRSLVDRMSNAALIGAASGLLFVAAIAAVRLGPFVFNALLGDGLVIEILSVVVRWGIAAGLLVLVVMLMVRVAPDMERPVSRVSVGAAVTVGGWILTSLGFGLYLEYIAVYDSVFGQLATIYIGFQYLALSAIVYLGGLTIDKVAISKHRG